MFGWFKKKKEKEEQANTVPVENSDLVIRFDALPPAVVVDDKQLVPITDKRLIARVSEIAPNFLQIANTSKVVADASEAVKGMGELYRAIIPNGAKLMDSKVLQGN